MLRGLWRSSDETTSKDDERWEAREATVILIACVPCVVITGGILPMLMSRMSSRGQAAYAEAGLNNLTIVIDFLLKCN
ncbi:hypothetical protein VIGAN_05010900 [Vigna angularis var. angularis]|uniref:Uncharacterized protein n=1 Tax=Vigna angularis var. angularis TaxID=157739 RepID=A0A0S3S1Y0_PHAAN|nr:hypothetical protein VIGAN_05010900 [Vigna angularis var. angularis]